MENKYEKLQLNYYLKDIESIVANVIISMMKNYLSIFPNSLIFRQKLGKRKVFIYSPPALDSCSSILV